MSIVGNNGNEKASIMRDSFFDSAERKYLEELLKDPNERKLHESLLREKAEKLYADAKEIAERVEWGNLTEEQMAEAEYLLTHLLAAIEDFQLALELEKDYDSDGNKKGAGLREKEKNKYYNNDDSLEM